MNADDFRQLREAFHAVVELEQLARDAHLAQLAAQDPALHEAVCGLLGNLAEQDLQPAAPESRVVGPYRLLQPLGSGGMGEVFLAERIDGGFEQRVALKLVRSGALSNTLTRRFLRERQILARLEHPHIARLLDGGFTAAGRPWLAMEYVAGQNIARHVQQAGLGLRERVALVAKVVAAVAYAQRNLVVHRDIKPANILVDAAGEPRLLDFGIATLLDDSGPERTRTAWRAMTTRYAAPEQIAGDRTTTATDAYALGVLLFELVSGHSPYAAAQAAGGEWSAAILREAPRTLLQACDQPYPARERRGLVGGLERIVQKALAKEPARRYAGAAALGDDLDDWLAGRPLRSGISGAREQTRLLLRRYRWPLTVLLAAVLALGAGLLVALQKAREAAQQNRIARAHLDAMLDVLGAASPRHYAGRDPPASEFLRLAAELLQQKRDQDPALLQRALSEIGHGLINLGKPHEAEPVLQAAVRALEMDPGATAAGKLGSYKLLAAVQDRPQDLPALRATAARIAALAVAPDSDAAAAIDALGLAAGSLARAGDFAAARPLFELGDRLAATVPDQASSAVENYWRQRGWSALRADDLDTARRGLERSLAVITAAPQAFSAMRRAEGEWLLAQALLAQSQTAAAQRLLDAARPVYQAEYPAGHPERALFDLSDAQLQLARGDTAAGQRLLAAAAAVLEGSKAEAKDRFALRLIQAELALQLKQCAAAWQLALQLQAEAQRLQPLLPRQRALAHQLDTRLETGCARQRPVDG